MLRGDDSWTQLLSEPGAGSDLGGVTTRAELEGDEWVVNGQKVWTSAAVGATYGLALLRTDPGVSKYAGISMMIIPMDAPGVDVRPLRQMSGDSDFNEVFLENVRVPRGNLVGELNDGWSVLNKMLTHERIALSAGTISSSMVSDEFDKLLALAKRRGVDHRPEIRHVLAEIYLQRKLLDYTGIRVRRALEAKAPMGPVGSIGKIGAARLARLTGEAGVLIGGESGIAWRDADTESSEIARALLRFPIVGIAGGTTEIQKNVVAERVLGLPRERRADRDTPFRDLPKNS
jgi:alkylation response protein AidB-like acyl-CoA dehydrogenase